MQFENDPDAGATIPAQEVFITDPLDANLDLTGFEFTGFGFGNRDFDVPPGLTHYETLIDLRPEGESLLVEGVRVLTTPGHTPYHQSVVVESQGEHAVFLADLCPTVAHLPLPWIMGYDVEPLVTLRTKSILWERFREEGWKLLFQHDTEVPWGFLDPDQEDPVLKEGS